LAAAPERDTMGRWCEMPLALATRLWAFAARLLEFVFNGKSAVRY